VTTVEHLRGDLRVVATLVPEGSRVLDLGCGDGALLAHLRETRDCVVRGVELSRDGIASCIRQGIPVVQADLDRGLADFTDASFDVVVLSQTLQVVHRPDRVVEEMLRVGSTGIVSFPNFAHWKVRGYLALGGRMPISRAIPHAWYDTPNIHHATIKDFRNLCDDVGAVVLDQIALASPRDRVKRVSVLPSLRAETAVIVVTADPRR
jgi:methionine biosynthesis protein MetW